MNSTSDSLLLERIATRDREAMLLLYDRYSTLVFSIALQLLQDVKISERITHETFLELWRDCRQLTKGNFELRTWLLVRSRHSAVQARRELGVGAPPRNFDEWQQGDSAKKANSTFDMAYREGMTDQEIAEITGRKIDEIRRELLAAMEKLIHNDE